MPLALAGRPGAIAFKATLDRGSYFHAPRRRKLTREHMEAIGSAGELASLAALWKEQGHDALLPLIPHLTAIAERIASERPAGDGTPDAPSRLIYPMY